MCHDPIVQAALLIAGAAVAVIAAIFVARVFERCETSRRQRLMDQALTRYEQSQHFWRASPVVDIERRA